MIFDENTVGVWFIAFPSVGGHPAGDWLASIRREPDHFRMEYRFRYHKDDKAFDSADEKKWYAADYTGSKEQAVAVMDQLLAAIEHGGGRGPYRLLRGDQPFETFMEKFLAAPFVNAQPVH